MNDIFDKQYKRYDAWYDKNKYAYLSELEAVRKVLPKEGRGLEIGVGTGRFAAPLGISMGLDPSHNMIEIARERGVNVRWGFSEDLPFRDAVFDYVAIIITLCFVKDPEESLKEARRVLRKNGRIIIGIIDKDSFLGKFYQKKKSIFYKGANFFNVREVTDLLKLTSFNRFVYYQTIFKLPDQIDSVERSKKGFEKGGFVVISGEKR